MYNIYDIGSTYMSLPPNLQTLENQCFGYALDRQMEKFVKMAEKLTMWSDLDNVDPKYYDHMASCIHAPYYKSEYSDDKKLSLIKTAIMSYCFAGTGRAVDQLIGIIFEDAKFIPWNEYEGAPYHFRVQASDVLTEDATKRFGDVLKKVKAARSVMDALEIEREQQDILYSGGYIKTVSRVSIREEF